MIRLARSSDVPTIVAMVGHFIGGTQYGGLFQFKPHAVTELVERVLEAGVIFVAEEAGSVVGMIAALPFIEPISKMRMCDELAWWVEPAHRKGSVGPRLLRALENWARQKELRLIKMIAPSSSEVGRYYSRNGYQAIETSYVKRLS